MKSNDFIISRVWLLGLVGQKITVGISNSFYVVFGPRLASVPNFINIGGKNTEVESFTFLNQKKFLNDSQKKEKPLKL